jgi:hypothetical protein
VEYVRSHPELVRRLRSTVNEQIGELSSRRVVIRIDKELHICWRELCSERTNLTLVSRVLHQHLIVRVQRDSTVRFILMKEVLRKENNRGVSVVRPNRRG